MLELCERALEAELASGVGEDPPHRRNGVCRADHRCTGGNDGGAAEIGVTLSAFCRRL